MTENAICLKCHATGPMRTKTSAPLMHAECGGTVVHVDDPMEFAALRDRLNYLSGARRVLERWEIFDGAVREAQKFLRSPAHVTAGAHLVADKIDEVRGSIGGGP